MKNEIVPPDDGGTIFLCASKVPGVDIGDCKPNHQDPPLDDFERIVGKIYHGESVEEDAGEGAPEEGDL